MTGSNGGTGARWELFQHDAGRFSSLDGIDYDRNASKIPVRP